MGKTPTDREALVGSRGTAATAKSGRPKQPGAESTSRKELRTSAPYRRAAGAPPPGAAPLARVQLVPAPAPTPERTPAPAPAAPAIIAAPAPAPAPAAPAAPPAAAAPAPVVEPPTSLPSVEDLAGAFRTAIGFTAVALAALPHPDELVEADPMTPAPPPGPAPSGDARSLRADDRFALVYRHGTAVVSRRGTLGQRGAWRVVDYPSATLAAHAYALECSRLVAQGYRDVG